MLIVNPVSDRRFSKRRPSNKAAEFEMFLEDSEGSAMKNENSSNSYHQVDDILNEYVSMLRLKLNELSYNRRIPRKTNFYFSDMEHSAENSARGSSKKSCPECQLIYKKNSMSGQSILPYLDENKKVKISI